MEHFYEIDSFVFSLVENNVKLVEEKVKNLDFIDEKAKKIFYINLLSQISAYNKYLAEKLVGEIEDIVDVQEQTGDFK